MGEIIIQDSGYIKPSNTGTQASSSNIAGAGTAVTLKTAEFVPSLTKNISSNPELGSNEPAEVNSGSLENMQFKLRCVLNNTNTADMIKVKYLLDMIRTYGYKFMWYNYGTATETEEKNNGQLIYQIGQNESFGNKFTAAEQAAFLVGTAYTHLHVLFTNMQPKHSSKNLISYELSGIVLPVEDSQLT